MLAGLVLVCLVAHPAPTLRAQATPKAFGAAPPSRAQLDFFENKIRPVLAERCFECHSAKAKKLKGQLRLDSAEGLSKGGENGPEIVPGDPEHSRLINAIRYVDKDLQMPPKTNLPPDVVADFEAWVKMGAPYPQALAESGARRSGEEGSTFWSFRPIQKPLPPAVRNTNWPINSIDNFILAKLDEKKLTPAPAADKRTLIRRAYFDLIGLPPPPDRIERFLADDSPQAYPNLIDELLASKQYGERWARHWLDAARYADSGGYETDIYYRNAWRYRDYVVDSFNDDKPYDRFVQEQIAGDELWPDDLALDGTYKVPKEKLKHLEARIATGLYTLGPQFHESNLEAAKRQYEWLTDCADTTASVFMGLTMACARCHDHKFDSITQRDYYALQAVFAGSKEVEIPTVPAMGIADFKQFYPRILKVSEERKSYQAFQRKTKNRPLTEAEKQTKQKLIENLARAVMELPEDTADNGPFVGLMEIPTASVLGHEQPELVRPVNILNRGDLKRPREKATPDIPAVLRQAMDWNEELSGPFGSRQQFALWLTSTNHPLTARVMVNRLWQWHFGRGLVTTANDFGKMGQPPSHPELLDWLAQQFMAQGWSLKKMHRLLMLSRTYQMASRFVDEGNSRLDPDNRLLWRMNRRRLEAEELWDALQSVAGTLNPAMGGCPVVPPLADEEAEALRESWYWPVTADAEEHHRRGLYFFVRRNFRFPMFDVFDSPVNFASAPGRDETTVAPQALWFLNNKIAWQQAQEFAARLVAEDTAGWNKQDLGGGQPGWQAPAQDACAGWAKRIDSAQFLVGFDAPAGTVMTYAPSSVLYRVPSDDRGGALKIVGSLWHIRRVGYTNAWKLWKNDSTLITEGQLEDKPGESANPFSLSTGTGGSAALTNITYAAGDSFRLEILGEDFVGVNLTIQDRRTNDLAFDFTLASNPTPTGWQYSAPLKQGGGPIGPLIEARTTIAPDHWIDQAWRIALGRPPSPLEEREALLLFVALSRTETGFKTPEATKPQSITENQASAPSPPPVAKAEEKPSLKTHDHPASKDPSPDNLPLLLAGLPPRQALAFAQLCLALFNLNEFMYVD